MNKKSLKQQKIIDIALNILRQEGDNGITMRRIASLSNMSLSNVQYYFKNKDLLLQRLAQDYFQQCLDALSDNNKINNHQELVEFVQLHTSKVVEISEMCLIFRQYWAMSDRNETIDKYLKNYYKVLAHSTEQLLMPLCAKAADRLSAAQLLITFIEGLSITSQFLKFDIDTTSKGIVAAIEHCLKITTEPRAY